MARTRTTEPVPIDIPVPVAVTTGRRWAYRVMISVGGLLLFGTWRALDKRAQSLAVWLHNWAGPHADELTGAGHTKPITGHLVPHRPYFADPAAMWIVAGFAVTVIVAGFYLLGKTSPRRPVGMSPFVAAARGAGKATAVVVGGVVVLALAGWLATKWSPARPVVGLGLRVVATLASAASVGIGVAAP